MNEKERFKAICKGQNVDYVPLIGLPGASGLSFGGAWGQIHQRLLDTGMPARVKGWNYETRWDQQAAQSWSDYWGTLTPLSVDFWPSQPCPGVQSKKSQQGDYEIVEYNTGAVTRQVLDNDNAYSMPEFISYHVRGRESWELYKELNTPGPLWSVDKINEACRCFDNRDKPLFISLLSTWGAIRDLMGTERACTILYDDPELAQEIIQWQDDLRKTYLFPLVERLRPEIIQVGEDCCYNHGMQISPQHFLDFCGPSYRQIVELSRSVESDVVVVDTDGKITDFVPLLNQLGVNGVYPIECKSNNDLFTLRQQYPEFVFFGWLEKEVVNKGNESMIESEIYSKVPNLLQSGRYFPNLDHSLQPMCTFENLRKFLSLLHKVTNNPNGEFITELSKSD
jgi:uroporphyrinogen-III decarboxylase